MYRCSAVVPFMSTRCCCVWEKRLRLASWGRQTHHPGSSLPKHLSWSQQTPPCAPRRSGHMPTWPPPPAGTLACKWPPCPLCGSRGSWVCWRGGMLSPAALCQTDTEVEALAKTKRRFYLYCSNFTLSYTLRCCSVSDNLSKTPCDNKDHLHVRRIQLTVRHKVCR